MLYSLNQMLQQPQTNETHVKHIQEHYTSIGSTNYRPFCSSLLTIQTVFKFIIGFNNKLLSLKEVVVDSVDEGTLLINQMVHSL